MEKEKQSTLISIQLSNNLLSKVKIRAKELNLSVSAYLRLLAIKDLDSLKDIDCKVI